MRTRSLKPSFFSNEQLGALPLEARYLFAGLWCAADREGRLEDRPLRLRAEVFPYDACSADEVDTYLSGLEAAGLIQRYVVGGQRLIYIVAFVRHQHPHPNETPSTLPPPPSNGAATQKPDLQTVHTTQKPDHGVTNGATQDPTRLTKVRPTQDQGETKDAPVTPPHGLVALTGNLIPETLSTESDPRAQAPAPAREAEPEGEDFLPEGWGEQPDPEPQEDVDQRPPDSAPDHATTAAKTNARRQPIDAEYLAALLAEFAPRLGGQEAAQLSADKALNHKAYDRAKDKRQYLRNWLRTDAARVRPAATGSHHGQSVRERFAMEISEFRPSEVFE